MRKIGKIGNVKNFLKSLYYANKPLRTAKDPLSHIDIKVKEAKEFLVEYFDIMDVPADEKGLVEFVIEKFSAQQKHFADLIAKYDENHKYPDYKVFY